MGRCSCVTENEGRHNICWKQVAKTSNNIISETSYFLNGKKHMVQGVIKKDPLISEISIVLKCSLS